MRSRYLGVHIHPLHPLATPMFLAFCSSKVERPSPENVVARRKGV